MITDISKTVLLYCDNKWLIIHKPTGISTHAVNQGDLGIAEWMELHHNIKVYICSRLDKGTSGVLVFALTPEASGIAENIHKNNLSKKNYYFLSDRKPPVEKSWRCRESLDGKECETSFELEREGNGYFLYRAEISRGRKHQIRRHASLSGLPVLGDEEYGGTSFPRLCLHCGEISWPGLPKRITVKLPQSFEWLLAGKKLMIVDVIVAYERRLDWLLSTTNAFRLVHRGEVRDLDFAIDIFDSWICVTGFDEKLSSEKLRKKLVPILEYFSKVFACRGGVVRINRRNPHQNKLFSEIISWRELPPDRFLVREHGLLFEVTFNESKHVGLFLDQRDSRRRLGKISQGKRVANLFSFTCSFSVVSVKSDAEVVFSVDLASGTLKRGKSNFSYNNIAESGRGKFIKEDVQKWLARQIRKKKENSKAFEKWDLVICDPPVFASSGKGLSFSVEREWPGLANNIREILSDKGIALFVNNHRGGSEKYYFKELAKCFAKVITLRPPFDFPELKDSPPHVRIYWCEV